MCSVPDGSLEPISVMSDSQEGTNTSAATAAVAPHVPECLLGPEAFGFCTLSLERCKASLPLLILKGHSAQIEDDKLALGLHFIYRVLQLDVPFVALWDVRECSLPSRTQTRAALQWTHEHACYLDVLMKGIVILLNGHVTRGTSP